MLESLPERRLEEREFDKLKEQNPGFHRVISSQCGDGQVSGIMVNDDGQDHLVLYSPREDCWVHYDALSSDLDVEEQGARIQEFISEHYPDDHVLNEDGKGDLSS